QDEITIIEVQNFDLKQVLQPDTSTGNLEEATANVGDSKVFLIAGVVDGVVAGITLQIVIAGTSKDHIIAFAAKDGIVGVASRQRIVAAEPFNVRIFGLTSGG